MKPLNNGDSSQEKPALLDWDHADIVYALHKRGVTLSALSRQNGYLSTSLRRALHAPWPKGESIIAKAIGVDPQRIWPSRYHPDGRPKSRRGERGLGRKYHPNARRKAVNHSGDGSGARAR